MSTPAADRSAAPGELPAVEPIWVVEATYADDAAETRPPYRAEHLSGVVELKAAGVIIEAGAFTDLTGSLLLVRGSSEEEVLEMCRRDVYHRHGVWTALRARPFGRVI